MSAELGAVPWPVTGFGALSLLTVLVGIACGVKADGRSYLSKRVYAFAVATGLRQPAPGYLAQRVAARCNGGAEVTDLKTAETVLGVLGGLGYIVATLVGGIFMAIA